MRRTIGLTTILKLTPLAVLIAFGGSCAATFAFLNTNLVGQNYGLIFLAGWGIFLIPPAVVLIAMVPWAIRASQRSKQ